MDSKHHYALMEGVPYLVHVQGGIKNNNKHMSVNEEGSRVDLYTHDDASGRQVWVLRHLGNNVFNISIQGGVKNANCFFECAGRWFES